MPSRRIISSAACLLTLLSCSREVHDNGDMLPSVAEMIADTSSVVWTSSGHFAANPEKGTIAIVGEPEDVIRVTEFFLTADMHDNINGHSAQDGLPDFSGETIAACLDINGAPYSHMAEGDNSLSLRNLCVDNFVLAVDTLEYVAVHDDESARRKLRSKAVIFASSYASAYGAADVDSLLSRTSSGIASFSPVKSMLKLAGESSSSPLNIAVWADAAKAQKNIYAISLPATLKSLGIENASFQSFVLYEDDYLRSRPMIDRLVSFLDMYVATETGKPLTTIMLDDASVDPVRLKSAVAELRSSTSDELKPYRRLLRDDFTLVTPAESMAQECYAFLRSADAFTHMVSYPLMKLYFTSSPESSGKAVMVEMNDRYFPSEYMDFMETNAPKSFSIYAR